MLFFLSDQPQNCFAAFRKNMLAIFGITKRAAVHPTLALDKETLKSGIRPDISATAQQAKDVLKLAGIKIPSREEISPRLKKLVKYTKEHFESQSKREDKQPKKLLIFCSFPEVFQMIL